MCTVSFVPAKDGYVFTFNRDEKPDRYTPNFISQEQLQHKTVYFAKDSKAGGTWFAADSLGNVVMLFNGAFTKHEKLPVYVKSRGIILREMIAAQDAQQYFENRCLQGIEPFSVILFENKGLFRLTWDGVEKHAIKLLKEAAYIFSSSTLYSDTIQEMRRKWFASYLQMQPQVNSRSVMEFHSEYKREDRENGLIIEREAGCCTLSISQAVIQDNKLLMKHHDVRTGKIHQQQIALN